MTNIRTNFPPRRTPLVKPRTRVRGRMDSDMPFMERYHCAVHQVTYYVRKDAIDHDCPVCDKEEAIDILTARITEMRTDLELAMQSTQRLSVQVSELDAMRKSLELIGHDDFVFIKSVLYRWRSDETSLTLLACQDAEDRWQFLVRVKKAGSGRINEEHLCSSIGGIALASSFEQATKVSGHSNAMRQLVRAVSQHLATIEEST